VQGEALVISLNIWLRIARRATAVYRCMIYRIGFGGECIAADDAHGGS
jgi:hypothetical protein